MKTHNSKPKIPFNKPYVSGGEIDAIKEACTIGQLSGDGLFTRKCSDFLEKNLSISKILLTHSCTAALEMSALLLNLQVGDEIIFPSYTFVSTVNAFALRGITPVFVDINPVTLNIDELQIEKAITPKTKAIVVVHYAGISCEMDTIRNLASNYNLDIIEDAAQAIGSKYNNKMLGSIGDLSTFSFHETKNIICGEGGALAINNIEYAERSEIIREKGTNRSKFLRGETDKYTWVDFGSSYLPSELNAAFLYSQLKNMNFIHAKRSMIWNYYHNRFADLEDKGWIRRPVIPHYCTQNYHMYYILLNNQDERDDFIAFLREEGIYAVFHYVPLHSSPFGKNISKCIGDMKYTTTISQRLVRLPFWIGVDEFQDYICEKVEQWIKINH